MKKKLSIKKLGLKKQTIANLENYRLDKELMKDVAIGGGTETSIITIPERISLAWCSNFFCGTRYLCSPTE